MTQEEIQRKAYKIWPVVEEDGSIKNFFAEKNQEKYREAYTLCANEYESLPKITAFVARDDDGCLGLFQYFPERIDGGWAGGGDYQELEPSLFPQLKYEDEPIEVELLIRKK